MFNRLSLTAKILLPIIGVVLILLAAFSYLTYQRRLSEAQDEARTVAEAVQRQVAADRAYYTSQVVSTILESGIEVTDTYHDSDNPAVPFARDLCSRGI